MSARSKTPIFARLQDRYQDRPAAVNGSPESAAEWADRAWMRGVLYAIVLRDTMPDPIPPRPFSPLNAPEPWHYTFPSRWDAIDATPNEHHPDL